MSVFSESVKVSKDLFRRLYEGVSVIDYKYFKTLEDKLYYLKRSDLLTLLEQVSNMFHQLDNAKNLALDQAGEDIDCLDDTIFRYESIKQHYKEQILSKLTQEERNLLNSDDYVVQEIKTHSLSRSQILMVLYLHYVGMDANGIVRAFNIKHCANTLGITEKTVVNNIDFFNNQVNGIIQFTKLETGIYSCYVRDHNIMTTTGEKTKSPYLQLKRSVLTELTNVQGVNQLKMMIRKILASDNAYDSDNRTSFSLTTCKKYVSKPNRTKRNLDKILRPQTSLFEDYYKPGEGITFRLKDNFDYKRSRESLISDLKTELKVAEEIHEFDLLDKASDLIQMCVQYGRESVLDKIGHVINKYIDSGRTIDNFCGLVRTFIERDLYSNLKAI